MKLRYRTSLILLIAAIISCPSQAVIDINVVKQIQYYSGSEADIEGSYDGYGEVLNQLSVMAKIYDQDKKRALHSSFNEAFDTLTLKNQVEETLSKELNEKDSEFLLNWFLSPLGRKISEEEKLSHSSEHRKDRGRYIATDENRIKLVTKIWNTIGIIDYQINNTIDQMSLLFKAVNALNKESESQISEEKFISMVNSQRDSIRNTYIQKLVNGSVYDYRNLSDTELKDYEEFMLNQTTIKYYKAYFTAKNNTENKSVNRWILKLHTITGQD